MQNINYSQKKQRLVKELAEIAASGVEGGIGLGKSTSNLFRDRTKVKTNKLNVRDFNQVIKVNKKDLTVEVEGMTTYEELADATLKHGLVPLVVPELKTITIGGGVSGLAIESSSFKYGLAHESVLKMDVLLASGEVVTCSPNNEYRDLFYAIPNSYGTLGYVIKVTARLRRIKPFVKLQHIKFDNPLSYFEAMNKISQDQSYEKEPIDFIDGVVFGPNDLYITLGTDVDEAPYTSDYTRQSIYYKSLKTRSEDYLTNYDYIWRWDTDWFWCSRIIKADKPIIRRLIGKNRLGSRTYSKMMYFEQRHQIGKRINRLQNKKPNESVIQDVEVPIKNALKFLDFFHKIIKIKPIWVCPTKSTSKDWPYSLYPMNPSSLYINFGFWDSVKTTKNPDLGYYNKLIEAKIEELGGMKSLYSTSFYDRPKFEKLYNYPAYKKLKKRYDRDGRYKDLYDKVMSK
jgi:FAD/FMN-containing dehydrogenase